MFIDPLYLIFALPGLILALLASFYTKSTFAEYAEKHASSGMTGAEAAERLLSSHGIRDVRIERVDGFLTDHYDPTAHTLRLSSDVYAGTSLSSIGVACHEAGHALQHASAFFPLHIRSLMVPATQLCSPLSYFVILLGFIMQSQAMVLVGAVLFSAVVLFAIVTLPVEWDASARAKKLMVSCGIVSQAEAADAGKVLNAAFMTYVASAVSALLTLLYYLLRSGILGGRRD